MAKSKIIKELANKEVSLEVAFNRLLIIASDLNNDDLVNWATNFIENADIKVEGKEKKTDGFWKQVLVNKHQIFCGKY